MSDWINITQERIVRSALATRDGERIHVDVAGRYRECSGHTLNYGQIPFGT